jgi:hypothetical protein
VYIFKGGKDRGGDREGVRAWDRGRDRGWDRGCDSGRDRGWDRGLVFIFFQKKPHIPIPHQFEMTHTPPIDFVYFNMFVFCNKNLLSENQNLIIS